MNLLKWILIALFILAILVMAGYLHLYNQGLSGKVLEVDPPAHDLPHHSGFQ